MTQKELIYVTTVAKMKSVSKAAEALDIAQPSLSRGIQKVESELGAELFKRTPDGLKLTAAGECYLLCAEAILKSYKNMEIELSNINEMKAGRLVIGTTTFLGSFVLPDVLKAFHALYPNIVVSIMEDVSTNVEEAILRGEVDLGILHAPLVTEGIAFEPLAQERFLLAVPPQDPLNDQAFIWGEQGEHHLDIRLTANRDWIFTHPTQRTRQITTRILEQTGINPKIRYLTKSIQTAMRLVSSGLGLTLVPHSYCSLFSRDYSPNCYFIEPRYNPTWELGVCFSKEIPLSRAAKEMIRIGRNTLPYLYKSIG